nr:hypothetical protein [Saprospiraceae bacterium]
MDKAEYKKKAKQTVDDFFDKIETMEKKKTEISASARQKYNEQLAQLNAKKSELKSKYKNLENEAGDKWKEAQTAFDKSANSFKEGFKHLNSLLKTS